MNLNQLSIIGFLGKDAETKYLPNGTAVTKVSVATKRSGKDESNEWKEKTQWHNVVAFGKGFEQLANRLVKALASLCRTNCPRASTTARSRFPPARAKASTMRFSSLLSNSEPISSAFLTAPTSSKATQPSAPKPISPDLNDW